MFEQLVSWENDKKTQKQKLFFPHGGIKKRSDLSTLFIFFWTFCVISEESYATFVVNIVGELCLYKVGSRRSENKEKKLGFLFIGWQSMASISGFDNTIKKPWPDFTKKN